MVAKISIKINNYINNKYFEPGVAGVRCRVHRLERGQALDGVINRLCGIRLNR